MDNRPAVITALADQFPARDIGAILDADAPAGTLRARIYDGKGAVNGYIVCDVENDDRSARLIALDFAIAIKAEEATVR